VSTDKISRGWVRAVLIFEVLGVTEEVVEKSLKGHVEKLEKDPRVEVVRKEFFDIEEVESPYKNVEKAYSCICEVELLAKNFDSLFQIVMEFGPSSCEILEPEKITLDLSQAQGILNSLADMMHRFTQAGGVGGVVIVNS